MALGTDFVKRAFSIMNREFGFTRFRIVQGGIGLFPQDVEDFLDAVEDASETGRITDEQTRWILGSNVILKCRRPGETEPTWVAVEVAARVDADDINRALLSAQALRLAFGEDALPVIAGERIDPQDAARLEQAGVSFIDISQRF